ncbi:MAG TPA: secretin and TonB N-terminal domain-containing protein [Smithellaceae bacterium]|nr:secretin and TonB N-terminal domain-containing protein [Smithella sp.]HPL97675.1 secretin and TonB N-terminal domain-containing protein [Smithellaceae bacterium]
MRKYLSRIIPVFIVLWVFFYTPAGVVTGSGAPDNAGYLEKILLEDQPGREKVILEVSQLPTNIPASLQGDNSLLVRLENLYVPNHLRETLKGNLQNITDVRAEQKTERGKPWVYLTIRFRENTPYSIVPEGNRVIVDFNISGVASKVSQSRETAAGEKQPAQTGSVKRYTDRIISLDFQDAEIKSVLRLMAEYGNISIISGDDVKGNVTLTLKSIPWDQALDAILNIKGLTKKQTDDVIIVMTLAKKKQDEADRQAAFLAQQKAEEEQKAREQKSDIEKGKLRQIMIEAKIVEASEDFVRNLGVQWGVGNNQNIAGAYGLGISAGTNPFRNARQNVYKYPDNILGIDRAADVLKEPFDKTLYPLTMAAVNMPTNIIGPTLGLVFGGAHGFIETQLSALESTTQGKIISSPRIVTMDDVKAVIKQGEEVPYITPATPNTPATVAFKDAVLRLEVKPKITEDNRISMDIKATNDRADYTKANAAGENPPIVKNEVESKVVVKDGDTVVIGGISKNQEDKTVAGVPWFYKIPVLGWLFKTENITKNKRQLLIFITPKILTESGYIEDECDTTKVDNLDRCRRK